MPLTFHEPNEWAMVVMDGKRPIAKARKKQVGYWLLVLESGCWVDPRARQPLRDDMPAGFSDLFSKYPNMLAVKGKREARALMKGLLDAQPGNRPARPAAGAREAGTARP